MNGGNHVKKKTYRIKLWMNEKFFCKWDVYARDNTEAQSICEHLKQCCINNGGWNPIRADIKAV